MNNVPPGYKQTEVGVIPDNWDVLPFKEVFNIVEFRRELTQSMQ